LESSFRCNARSRSPASHRRREAVWSFHCCLGVHAESGGSSRGALQGLVVRNWDEDLPKVTELSLTFLDFSIGDFLDRVGIVSGKVMYSAPKLQLRFGRLIGSFARSIKHSFKSNIARGATTWQGFVTGTHCGTNCQVTKDMTPDKSVCVCVCGEDPTMVCGSNTACMNREPQDKAARFAATDVTVIGGLDGEIIHIDSIGPIKPT